MGQDTMDAMDAVSRVAETMTTRPEDYERAVHRVTAWRRLGLEQRIDAAADCAAMHPGAARLAIAACKLLDIALCRHPQGAERCERCLAMRHTDEDPASRMRALERVQHTFQYHPPYGTQVQRYTDIRLMARQFATLLIERVPPGLERTQALADLRTAVMWANAGIACNERQPREIGTDGGTMQETTASATPDQADSAADPD